jgi:hypothetical protein
MHLKCTFIIGAFALMSQNTMSCYYQTNEYVTNPKRIHLYGIISNVILCLLINYMKDTNNNLLSTKAKIIVDCPQC